MNRCQARHEFSKIKKITISWHDPDFWTPNLIIFNSFKTLIYADNPHPLFIYKFFFQIKAKFVLKYPNILENPSLI